MPDFHDVVFPLPAAFGARGGPEFKTDIVPLASGHEYRNSPLSGPRRRYEIDSSVQGADGLAALTDFFHARRGRLHAFRFRDRADDRSCAPEREPAPTDQVIGIGDGVSRVFRLVKTYADSAETLERMITKPVVGSVRVAVDGMEQAVTVDTQTGHVTFSESPSPGAVITAGFLFHVPVRFDTDRLDIVQDHINVGQAVNVSLVEVLDHE